MLSDAALFWKRVEKTDGCWLWRGATNGRYGRFRAADYAHRVSWEIAFGSIPKGLQVLHHCDVPLCVRPDHLFLGTQADNIADARSKGRLATGDRHGLRVHPDARARGERHGSRTLPGRFSRGEHRPLSKLTNDQVREVRVRGAVETQTALAAEFGVSRTVIGRILRGQAWRHVE